MSSDGPALRMSRTELYGLVWEQPVRKIATDAQVSDVAIQKACARHRIPTPPRGHWAKVHAGKPVAREPLPALGKEEGNLDRVVIYGQWQAHLEAHGDAEVAAVQDPESVLPASCPERRIIDATIEKLQRSKIDNEGLVTSAGSRCVKVAVRPESVPRVRAILTSLFATAKVNSLALAAQVSSAKFVLGAEAIQFAIEEVAEKVPHTATEQELEAVAKYELEKQAAIRARSFWYRRPPKIPKWEERRQGRLAVKLEEVPRLAGRYGSTNLRSLYADTRGKHVEQHAAMIVAAVIQMMEVKRANDVVRAERRAAEEEDGRREREAYRLQAIRAQLEPVVTEMYEARQYLAKLDTLIETYASSPADESLPALKYFLDWMREERERKRAAISPAGLARRLGRCYGLDI